MILNEEQKLMMQGKLCPYCGKEPEYVDSEVIYKTSYGMIYLCKPCDAYVGTHKRWPKKALGRLANAELREWKKKAHEAFDPLWQQGIFESRNDAYGWLSDFLKLPIEYTHIGMFGVDTCKKVVLYIESNLEKIKVAYGQ